MGELYFDSRGIISKIAAVESDIKKILADPFTFHYMIGAERSENPNFDVQVIPDSSVKDFVSLDYPLCRYNHLFDHREIVVLAEYLMERCRQEKKGCYSLSSASASFRDSAVLFFGGATHLGKTSSMLTLVQKCGFEFLSDEKSIISLDALEILPGANSVPTRKKIIRDRFFNSDASQGFAQLVQANQNKKAKLFIYPHLDHGLEKPICYRLEPLDFFWLLTREFSSVIRGSVRMVNNFSYLIPSLDTQDLANKRIASTKNFCNMVPCYYFQGSLDQIEKYIPEMLAKECSK